MGAVESGSITPPLTLTLLGPDDAADILAFEQENRAYFAQIIGDRGEAFFADYETVHTGLLAEIARGESLLYLVRDTQEKLVGRVNFTRMGTSPAPLKYASLGYRFAEATRGQGYATAAVAKALALATAAGVQQVRATVAHENPASRRVLEKVGFGPLPQTGDFVERNGRKILVQHYFLQLEG